MPEASFQNISLSQVWKHKQYDLKAQKGTYGSRSIGRSTQPLFLLLVSRRKAFHLLKVNGTPCL